MTSLYETPTDRQDSIDNVVECLCDIAELVWKFPITSLMDEMHLSQEVEDNLEKLAHAVATIVNEGPEILWAFAQDRGLADEVGAILDEQAAADQSARDDPNSLINIMRRKYHEQS